jgi:transcriptional regulator with XRE-family HTH domain
MARTQVSTPNPDPLILNLLTMPPHKISKLRLAMMEEYPGSQKDFAQLVGIKPPLLSNYLCGQRPIPAHHLFTLSRLLHRNPTDLIGMV